MTLLIGRNMTVNRIKIIVLEVSHFTLKKFLVLIFNFFDHFTFYFLITLFQIKLYRGYVVLLGCLNEIVGLVELIQNLLNVGSLLLF